MADNNTTLRKINHGFTKNKTKHGYYSLNHGNHKLIMVLLHDIVFTMVFVVKLWLYK